MQQTEKFTSLQKMPCPYPDCQGTVVYGSNFCMTCRRGIMVCPSCGQRMLARENPFCRNCGYTGSGTVEASPPEAESAAEAGPPEQAITTEAPLPEEPAVTSGAAPPEGPVSTEQTAGEALPVIESAPVEPAEKAPPSPPAATEPTPPPATVFTAGLDSKEVSLAIAEVYRQAALGTLNMHRVVDILEGLRKLAADKPDPYDFLDVIDSQVALAKGEDLRSLVSSFRTLIEQSLTQKNREQLHTVFASDPQAGWQRLVGIHAEALNSWRTGLCLNLEQEPFPLPATASPDYELIKDGTHYVSIDEWDKTLDLYLYLVENAHTSPAVTAGNLVTAGEVHYIRFDNYTAAEECLEKAEKIAPDDLRVVIGIGRYWLTLGEKEDLVKARERAEQAIQLHPQKPGGYALLGEIYLAENNLEQAEAAFRNAISVDPGQTSGYDGLFSLYERPDLLTQKQDQFPQLIRELVAISTDLSTEYNAYTRVGSAFSKVGDTQKALEWYQRAIDLDPSRQAAYLYIGNLFLDQSDYKQAEKYYRLGVETDPRLYTGYWNLGWMFELQSKWQAALREYKKCILLQPEKEAEFRNKIGEMERNLGHTQAAIREFFKALSIDPDYSASLNNLHDLVDEIAKSDKDRPTAQKIMDDLRAIQGESYEFTYQNRCGNIDYYARNYSDAIEHYMRALALSEKDAVVLGNLGRAYRGTGEWELSRKAFAQAFAFDANQKDFDWETGTTFNEQANLYFSEGKYRESADLYAQALQHMPDDDVVNSNLAGAWEQLILLESENRLAAIESAYQPMLKASQLQPDREDYRSRLEKLRLQKLVAENYGEGVLDKDPQVKTIYLDISSNLMEYVVVDQEGDRSLTPQMGEQAEAARQRFRQRWGIVLPTINFRELSGDFEQGYYEINLKEQFLIAGDLALNRRFCPQEVADLEAIGVKGQPDDGPPWADSPGCWVNIEDWQAVEGAGLPLWGIMEYPVRHIEGILTWLLDELLDLASVINLGEAIEPFSQIQDSGEQLAAFVRVLQALARERVSLAPFSALVAGFLECQRQSLDLLQTVERLRVLPEVLPVLPGIQGEWRYYQLPELEKELLALQASSGAPALLAAPTQNWMGRYTQQESWLHDPNGAAIIVEAAELRPYLSCWLHAISTGWPVLSRAELEAGKQSGVQIIRVDDSGENHE